jgi:S1-C subfamily serine protease
MIAGGTMEHARSAGPPGPSTARRVRSRERANRSRLTRAPGERKEFEVILSPSTLRLPTLAIGFLDPEKKASDNVTPRHSVMQPSGGATQQGAVIEEIGPGSPAQKAGFRIGDIIISLDRQAVKGVMDLALLVAAHKPGDMVEIVVLRGGKPLEFIVNLAGPP